MPQGRRVEVAAPATTPCHLHTPPALWPHQLSTASPRQPLAPAPARKNLRQHDLLRAYLLRAERATPRAQHTSSWGPEPLGLAAAEEEGPLGADF